MADPRITVEVLNPATLAVKTTLDESWGRQWQDIHNDCGFGKLTLQNDDPDLAFIEYGDLLRWSLDGQPRFMSIVETKDIVAITAEEEVAEVTQIGGRGTLAVWEDATVWPEFGPDASPFNDTRLFNWTSIDQDLSGYVAPYDWGAYPTAGPYANVPADFPDVAAHWLDGQAPDGFGDNPLGDWYLFAVGVAPDPGLYRLFIGVDDACTIAIDGSIVFSLAAGLFTQLYTADVALDAGNHFITVRVTNLPYTSTNPSGFLMSIIQMNPDGTFGATLMRTDPGFDFVLPWPVSPPGFTPGNVVRLLLENAQDRGALGAVTLDFTDADDSDGNPWPVSADISFQIGMDLLTMLKQLAETFFDMRMSPDGLTLSLYLTRGSATSASFTPTETITELKHAGVG